jgi:hypothetical protein
MLGGGPASGQEIRTEEIRFSGDSARVMITGRLQGRETVDYLIPAEAGDLLSVVLESRHLSCYFNLLPPGADTALHIGSHSGPTCSTRATSSGMYIARVYLMRNAARRGETARYTLRIARSGTSPGSSSTAMPALPPDRVAASGQVKISRGSGGERWTDFRVLRDPPAKSATIWILQGNGGLEPTYLVLRFADGRFLTADGAAVPAVRQEDNWIITTAQGEFCTIPDALLYGG